MMLFQEIPAGLSLPVVGVMSAVIGALGTLAGLKFWKPDGIYSKRLNGHLDAIQKSLEHQKDGFADIGKAIHDLATLITLMQTMVVHNKEVVMLQQEAVTATMDRLSSEVKTACSEMRRSA